MTAPHDRPEITPEAVAALVSTIRVAFEVVHKPTTTTETLLECAAMLEALQADNEALRAALDGTTVLPMLKRARAEAREETAAELEALQARVVGLEQALSLSSHYKALAAHEARAEALEEAAEHADGIMGASEMAQWCWRRAAEARQAAEPADG